MFVIFNRDTRECIGNFDDIGLAQWQIDMNQKKYNNCYAKYKG